MKKLLFLIPFFCIGSIQAYAGTLAEEVIEITIDVSIRDPQTITVEFPLGYSIKETEPLHELCTVLHDTGRLLTFVFTRSVGRPEMSFKRGVYVLGYMNGVAYNYHIKLNYVTSGGSGGGTPAVPVTFT